MLKVPCDRSDDEEGRKNQEVPCTMNDWKRTEVVYHTHRQASESKAYNEQIVEYGPMPSSQLQAQMQMMAQPLFPVDPCQVFCFSSGMEIACHNNAGHDAAAMWSGPLLMNQTAVASLVAKASLKPKQYFRNEGVLTTYSQVVCHLPKTDANNYVISGESNDLLYPSQSTNQTPL